VVFDSLDRNQRRLRGIKVLKRAHPNSEDAIRQGFLRELDIGKGRFKKWNYREWIAV
jgi:hypothetical protein